MILTYIAKKVYVLTYELHLLTFAPKSSTSSINSSHVKPPKANLILPLKCQGQSYVIISTFLGKSFKTFHEILRSRIFPCLILPYNRSRSVQGHHLNYLVSTLVPDATCKVSRPLVKWFWRRSFKGFYHIWAWWPYWSCDLDSSNIFLF